MTASCRPLAAERIAKRCPGSRRSAHPPACQASRCDRLPRPTSRPRAGDPRRTHARAEPRGLRVEAGGARSSPRFGAVPAPIDKHESTPHHRFDRDAAVCRRVRRPDQVARPDLGARCRPRGAQQGDSYRADDRPSDATTLRLPGRAKGHSRKPRCGFESRRSPLLGPPNAPAFGGWSPTCRTATISPARRAHHAGLLDGSASRKNDLVFPSAIAGERSAIG